MITVKNAFAALAALAMLPAALAAEERSAEILVAADAKNVVRFAAKELSEHWKKATGFSPAVVTAATGKVRWTFRLGKAAKIDTAAFAVNCGKVAIGGDGFVDIAGNDGSKSAMRSSTSAGTLFGVYSFLEKKLGVRWLWPGELGTVVPPCPRPAFAAGEWDVKHMAFATWRASGNANAPGWGRKEAAAKFYSDQSLWLRRHRFSTCDSLAKGHAFTDWFKRYSKDHPEWFNELPDGTRRPDPFYFGGRADLVSLCASNGELVKEIVRRWATEEKCNIINGNENDVDGKCCCASCLAADATGDDRGRFERARALFSARTNTWWRALGSESTRYARFWKALLEEGRKVRPDCRVIGCIYANYSDPPAPGTELGENVVLRFCPPVMYPWTKEKVKYFKDTWSGWSATGAKLMMRPNFTLDGHSFPLAYYRHYAECYDFIRANGLVAVDMDLLTGVYGANGLTLFVIASKNSSPDRALKDLEEDYFSAFGSAAGAMRECCEDFVKAADAGFMLDGKDDTIEGGRYTEFMLSAYRVFPPALIEKAIARLEAAKSAAREEVVVRRLEFVLAGLVEARLMLKTQRGFAKYQKCGDFADFSAGYKELIAHRRQNEALGFLNMKTVDFFESRLWPRHLGLLNRGARELNGWELKLNADIDAGKWEPVKVMRHWRPDYNGIGWYRVSFDVDDPSRYSRLVFGAVDGLPTVYLNGVVVQDGHPIASPGIAWRTPFAVDVKGRFKKGANELLVKIDKKVPGRRGINKSVFID